MTETEPILGESPADPFRSDRLLMTMSPSCTNFFGVPSTEVATLSNWSTTPFLVTDSAATSPDRTGSFL